MTVHLSASPKKWFTQFARFGLIAKGIVYCLTGIITLMAALNISNASAKDADKDGVFKFVYDQPMGKVALVVIAVGLLCYATWRLIEGIKDTEQKGHDLKGLGKRVTYIFSGLIYLVVAFYAAKIAWSNPGKNGDSKQDLAQQLLEKPFGQWLAGIVALIMVGSGLYQIFRAVSGKYKKHVEEGKMDNNKSTDTLVKAGLFGYIARGIVWLMLGWLFLKSALHSNAKEAGDSGNAFQWLESTWGSVIMALVSVGLICYGVFMFMRARYQPIHYK